MACSEKCKITPQRLKQLAGDEYTSESRIPDGEYTGESRLPVLLVASIRTSLQKN